MTLAPRPFHRVLAAFAGALCAVALLLAGCAGPGTESGELTFEASLAFVPIDGEIRYGDLTATQSALGRDGELVIDDEFTELGVFAPETLDATPLSLADAGRFVEWHGDDGTRVLAFPAGADAAARLTDALGDPVDGIWGEGEAATGDSPWIADLGGTLVITKTDAALQQVRNGQTAAGDERAVAVARALDERGVLAATMFEPRLVVLPDVSYVGGGVSRGGDGTRVHFVAVTSGDVDALATALRQKLEQGSTWDGTPFDEIVEVEDVSVTGDAVIVDARPLKTPAVWHLVLAKRELG